jgi:hypothetical protein
MNNVFKLFVLLGADAIAFGGRYSKAVWEDGNEHGQTVQYEIRDWFKRIGI